jgi:small neutral amino acid transporter SnatA (MarC family)
MERIMGIGTGVFLFIVGAIITFGLNFEVEWVDQTFIGYLFMAGGAVVFLISLVMVFKKRSTTIKSQSEINPQAGVKSTETRTESDNL